MINETELEQMAAALERDRKPKFEETHTKRSYWVRNDLLNALDKIATDHGEKTKLMNRGLELIFAELAGEIGPFPGGKEARPSMNLEELKEELMAFMDALIQKHMGK